MAIKFQADYSSFSTLDIRVGKIIKADDAATKKPTYKLTIDFGAEVGIKVSCGAYRNYQKADLVGAQVIAVVNFAPKKMGPEISEVLVLGVSNGNEDQTIYLTPQTAVMLGEKVF